MRRRNRHKQTKINNTENQSFEKINKNNIMFIRLMSKKPTSYQYESLKLSQHYRFCRYNKHNRKKLRMTTCK